LAGDVNAKHPFWNRAISNPSGHKMLQLFVTSDFEISAPQYPTHYSAIGNGDVLDIVVHKNIRFSGVIVSDILDSDHLPIMFHILDHVRTKQISKPLEKFTDWERFQSLASNPVAARGSNTYIHLTIIIIITTIIIIIIIIIIIGSSDASCSTNSYFKTCENILHLAVYTVQ
jgi:hypothetical protein